jgi:cytochrome c oxidase subunit 3
MNSEHGVSLNPSLGHPGRFPPRHPALEPGKVGMLAFLLSEIAFFSTLIMTYVVFLGKSQSGPTPVEVLSLPLVIGTTLCLLASSGTMHLADRALRHGTGKDFTLWWSLTIGLGALFLLGTAYEWHGLIAEHGLTIGRNMFGTTYYTLVGFHAFHVTAGVIVMTIILGLHLRGKVTSQNPASGEIVSWYWHFVDVVWVVVFTVVYLVGR